MIKKTTLISMMFSTLLLVSCGSKKEANDDQIDSIEIAEEAPEKTVIDDSKETVIEEPTQEPGYHPPFEFTAERLSTIYMVRDNEGKDYPSERTTIVCTLLPGGKLKGTYKRIQYSYPYRSYGDWNPEEIVASDRELSGKWSTSERSMGDDWEKCYGIDISFLNDTWYIPASGDYLFKGWFDCENNSTADAFKVLDIKQL